MHARRFRQLFFGVCIGLAGTLINLTPVGLALEERFGLYWLFQLRGKESAPDDVVIIAIDQPSAVQLDLPVNPRLWPRDLHAQLIEKLANAGASVIVFDLLFETPSDNPALDEQLARAMRKAGNVVLVERLDVEELPAVASQSNGLQVGAITAGTVPLLSIIERAALAQAPFPLPRAASVNTFWTFKAGAGDAPTLPVVALQTYTLSVYDGFIRLLAQVNPAYAAYLPADKYNMDVEELIFLLRDVFINEPQIAPQIRAALHRDTNLDVREKRLINALLNLYANGEIRYLNFYGPPRSVQTIPYYQVSQHLDNNHAVPGNADFSGKAVFIGFSAATQSEQDRIRDDYHTVFSNHDGLTISGVEIAATAFANLLEDKPVRQLSLFENLGLLFLFGFAAGVVFLVLPNRSATAVGVTLAAIYVGNASYQFAESGVWLPLFIPLFMQLPLAVVGSLSLKYYNEKRERKQIEAQFGRFLPERVVKHIKESSGQAALNNQLVYGVCLATDIENYTPLSEKMSPGRLSQLMNEYYAALFKPVEKHGGDISDVVGDAMLALWTAPSATAELRRQACQAGLDIMAAVDAFNQVANRPKLITRIGLHFGEMMLGSVGASRHFEYRAVGDVVNTANRIQGANKKLGTQVLLSREVVEGLDDFLIRPLGDFLLTGRSSSVSLVELIAHQQSASNEQSRLCEIFASALQAYQSQQWQQASDGFLEILSMFPDDGPAKFFLARCQQHQFESSAGTWHPIIQMTGK